jgi:hypothetical protein
VPVFGLQQNPEKSPVSQKISAVQPVGVSELPAVQGNAAWSNYGIATADKDFKLTSAVSDSYCVETRC